MNLSNRLETIISFVDKNSCVADIGSDHGYVVKELILRNIAKKCLAVENKIGPYNNLCKNLKGVNNIDISLSDGLDDLEESYTTVIIAGMGYDNIKKIIDNNIKKIDYISTFIIDSHTLTPKIRSYFLNIGYYIENEKCLIEKDIFYEVIKFKKGTASYDELDIKYGPILRKEKSEAFKTYYENEIARLRFLVKTNKIVPTRKKEIALQINELMEITYEN